MNHIVAIMQNTSNIMLQIQILYLLEIIWSNCCITMNWLELFILLQLQLELQLGKYIIHDFRRKKDFLIRDRYWSFSVYRAVEGFKQDLHPMI